MAVASHTPCELAELEKISRAMLYKLSSECNGI
jgi:hypothetical protein